MRVGNHAGRLALILDDLLIDVETASHGRFRSNVPDVYERWHEFSEWGRGYDGDDGTADWRECNLQAPSPRPRQVFAIGANYEEHIKGLAWERPSVPLVFTKFPSCLTGPFGEIELTGDQVDWEVELVAIIGALAWNVGADEAWSHIAGLTVGQDISDRARQLLPPSNPQHSLGKSLPGFGPTGPVLVTPDEFADLDNIRLGCRVQGEEMQQGTTKQMIFSLPQLVEWLSSFVILLPGDLIFCGTPAGVGKSKNPPRYLEDGDQLVSYIDGIGVMRHTFVTPKTP